jgi:actin-related protein 5
VNYQEELNRWADSDHYDNNVRRIQLPYTVQAVTPGLTPEQQKERRKELARRLIEINARKREERGRFVLNLVLEYYKSWFSSPRLHTTSLS